MECLQHCKCQNAKNRASIRISSAKQPKRGLTVEQWGPTVVDAGPLSHGRQLRCDLATNSIPQFRSRSPTLVRFIVAELGERDLCGRFASKNHPCSECATPKPLRVSPVHGATVAPSHSAKVAIALSKLLAPSRSPQPPRAICCTNVRRVGGDPQNQGRPASQSQ